MNPYAYPEMEPRFNLHLKETTGSWLRYQVDFPVAQPTPHQENNTGHGDYYYPRRGYNGSLAILIHGWGDRSTIPCRLLAKTLVKRGTACFILYLVFHSSRMPAAMRHRFPNLTPEEWFQGYRTSVVDVRQITDWAVSRPDINQKQIAVIGISLGGSIAAISMGIDKRLSTGIFIVTGGNYENPVWLKKKRDSRQEAAYEAAQKRYAGYLTEVAEKGLEKVSPLKQSYLTDPMTFAGYLRRRPVMMINSLWDEIIPKQATLDFWEACAQPPIRWFPATHASIWLLYPLVRKQIVDFLSSALTA